MQHLDDATLTELSASHRRPSLPSLHAVPEAGASVTEIDPPVPGPIGRVIAGRYTLGHCLGRGAIGAVFLADDASTGGEVAVKLLPAYGLSPAMTEERFEAEVRLNRSVTHANVVQVLDAGHTERGEPYVVSEALAGETLGDCLRARGAMSVDGALRVAREAARGLSAVHRAGIVHRDVKPDNLFLCDERRHGVSVKVLDFGFATLIDRRDDPSAVLGTVKYMAPEQVLAESVDPRADVYALGIVLFRALTGELPFDACARRGLVSHHLASPVPPPSWLAEGLDPSIDEVVLTAVRKHPRNRYPSMQAFLDDLDRALSGRPVRGIEPPVRPDVFFPSTDAGRQAFTALGALGALG